MAVKTYRALAKGYVDGTVYAEGEVFTTEFREVVREDPPAREMKLFEEGKGKRPVGPPKKDKDGNVLTVAAKSPPSWAEEVKGKQSALEQAVAGAQDDNTSQDPNLEEMDRGALEAFAAERHIQFTKKLSDDDLRTAIRAAADPTR